MSSVSVVPSGVSDLLQTFIKSGSSPVSPTLSSASVQSALAIASPGDLVQLSQQALQLQTVAGLFASSGASGGSDAATTDPLTALLQTLEKQTQSDQVSNPSSNQGTTGSDSTSPSATPLSTAATIAAANQVLAQQEAFALLGTNTATGAGKGTINLSWLSGRRFDPLLKQNLADVVAAFHEGVRPSSFRCGEYLVNYWLHLTGFDQRPDHFVQAFRDCRFE